MKCLAKLASPPVNNYKKKKPNNIYEMPIPSSSFETKMVFSGKMVYI